MKKPLPGLFLLLLSFSPGAQSIEADTVPAYLEKFTIGEHAEILNDLAIDFIYKDPFKTIRYAGQALTISRELNDQDEVAFSLKILGNVNYLQGNYTNALTYFLDSYFIYETLNDSTSMAALLGSISLVYKATGEYDKALDNYDKAYSMVPGESPGALRAKLLNNKGVIYRRLKEYEKAEEHFVRSMQIKEQLGDQKGVANTLTNLGNLMSEKGQNQGALNFFFRSLKLEKELQHDEGIAKNYNNIANIYLRLKNADSAIYFSEKGFEIAERLGTKIQIKEAAEVLNQAYATIRNYDKAYYFQKIASATRDSLFNEDEAKKIGRLESRLELVKKQNEIELLEKDNASRKIMQNSLITIIALIACFSAIAIFLLIQRFKLRRALLSQEIDMLRVQINSVFGGGIENLNLELEQINEGLYKPLTEREYEVLNHAISDKNNSEIAELVYVSVNTVKTHLKNIYTKLGVSNRKEALEVLLAKV